MERKANLALVYLQRNEDQKAEPLLRAALNTMLERHRERDMSVGMMEVLLGGVLVRRKQYQEAEKYLSASYAILATQPRANPKRLDEERANLAVVYDALHQPDKAAKFRTELAANQPH